MQRCQYCGFEFPENARFCGNCGREPVPIPLIPPIPGGSLAGGQVPQVSGVPFTFLIGLVAYHGPGTYTSNLTVNLIKVGTIVSMNNNGSLPVTITVTSSGKAGMVSSDLVGLVSATQTQPSTGHVTGNWMCA